MIRRQFDLDGKQVLVTYDPDTDTMHVGTRDNHYDSWSTPLTQVASDDDQVGRQGGPGSARGMLDLTSDQPIIERLRAIVTEADDQARSAQTAQTADQPDTAQPLQVAAVPNQTRSPQQDTTAMIEDPRRDRRGS